MNDLSQKELQQFLEIASDAARKAGTILISHWGKLNHIREKSSAGDLVTEVDTSSEELIIGLLQNQFPNHDILSEETGLHAVNGADFMWAIDPLDGTTNYAHQLPIVCISIALLYHKEPVVAVVYNPFMSEMFQAVHKGGATLNGKSIAVSKVKEFKNSLLATGFAYDRKETFDNNYAEFCYMTGHCHGVRRMGSAALDLSYVACGRFDGFWERGLNIWDIAAGTLLVREAGGRTSSYEGETLDLQSGRILASNGLIHQEISRNLIKAKKALTPIVWDSELEGI